MVTDNQGETFFVIMIKNQCVIFPLCLFCEFNCESLMLRKTRLFG